MIKIELIYDSDCPNIKTTRARLKKALSELAIDIKWIEWMRNESSTPPYVQRYGSPTILIDGRPIGKNEICKEGISCSIYRDENGSITRAPSVDQISTAIKIAIHKREKRPIIATLSSGTAGILALIPFIFCPICWPAYASLLATLGIGFFNYTPYLIPLLFSAVVFVCFLIWRDYHYHKRIWPFLLALSGGALITVGKIVYPLNLLTYVGILFLLVSSVANMFYIKKITSKLSQSCKACEKNMEEKK